MSQPADETPKPNKLLGSLAKSPSSLADTSSLLSFDSSAPSLSPSSAASSSNWKASVELSLSTRRRLIRKPLPQLPGEKQDREDEQDVQSDSLANRERLETDLKQAEAWWPHALPEPYHTKQISSASEASALHNEKQAGHGLDDQSSELFLTILHYTALAHTSPTRAADEGPIPPSSSQSSQYIVDEQTLDSLSTALHESLRHLSTKDVLGSLQRTASIRWRAEAQLRNAGASALASGSSQASSRWARFAWPAAALGRAYREAQRSTLPPLPPEACADDHVEDDGSLLFAEQRIRKRDVAIKILSNAVWFVRNYGPVVGLETLAQKPLEAGEAVTTRPTVSGTQRPSENLIKMGAGAPNFLVKSTPTIALSGTATPETHHGSSQATASSSSRTSTISRDGGASVKAEMLAHLEDAREDALPKPAAPVSTNPSKAMEQLASLNAAAGAALRAQAQAHNESDAFSDSLHKRLQHQSSRPSLRSVVSHQTQAEAAETVALEKAEREYLAAIGKGCDEWAKMVLCRICTSFEVQSDDDNKGTLTAKDVKQGQINAGSAILTRSDMTAKAFKLQSDDGEPVTWLPDVFEGNDLFSSGGESSKRARVEQQDHDNRVRTVGGTFSIKVKTEAQKQALTEVLEVMVYVGCSMLLEASFLRDSDTARPKIIKVPTRTTSAADPTLGQDEDRPRSTSEAGIVLPSISDIVEERQKSPTSAQPESPKASRRWTKSLWGMLQSRPAVPSRTHSRRTSTDAGDTPPSQETSKDSAQHHNRKASVSLLRTNTEGGSDNGRGTASSKRSGIGLPRSKTVARDDHQRSSISSIRASLGATLNSSHSRESSDPHSLSSRANAQIGRLMHAFVGRSETAGTGDEDKHDDEDKEAADQGHFSVPGNETTLERGGTLRGKAPPAKPVHKAIFPLSQPGPSPLTASPELAMLESYQMQHGQDATSYLDAFARLQSIRFLTNERTDIVTFATPSDGILPSGELYPHVGVNADASRNSTASLRSLQSAYGGTAQSRGQQQGSALQMLGCDVRRGANNGCRREEVQFYKRLSNSRDVPLGQLIEELCVRASSLEADARHSSDGKSKKKEAGKGIDELALEQRIQFLHGCHRVIVTATVLPTPAQGKESAAATDGDQAREGEEKATRNDSNAASLSMTPRRSNDTDVSAVAAALQTNKEAAKTAIAVAETAVRAAEKGTQMLVDGGSSSESSLWMWNANSKSGWQGRARPVSESTYLMSFARYLEAILYHPALKRVAGMEPFGKMPAMATMDVKRQLKEGKSEDVRSVAHGVNLLRLFRSGRALVKVQAIPVKVYELDIDGPVMQDRPKTEKASKEKRAKELSEMLSTLAEQTRLEIQSFFSSVKQRTTLLEDVFVERELDETGKTIHKRPAELDVFDDGESAADDRSVDASSLRTSVDSRVTISGPAAEPLMLLSKLITAFRADEFELYEALQSIAVPESVNDVRKLFGDRAKSVKNRLGAWIKKHLTKAELTQVGKPEYKEPEYFTAGHHAFPGSQYLVRESEPLSIVAFSLSSRDFRVEIGCWKEELPSKDIGNIQENVINWRNNVVEVGGSQISSGSSAISSSPFKEKGMRNVPVTQLDPDTDEVFYEPEPVQAALKRKKRGHESSSILSLTLRRVGSTVSSAASESVGARTPMSEVPPAVEGGDEQKDDGSAIDADTSVEIQDSISERALGPRTSSILAASAWTPQRYNTSTISSAATDSTFRAHITQVSARPASLASIFSKDPNESLDDGSIPEVHEGDGQANWTLDHGHQGHLRPSKQPPMMRSVSESVASTAPSSLTQDGISLAPSTALSGAQSPHIKHNLIHSNVKISCVSWFAAEFAALREKWGVDTDFAHSLSRCQPWHTTGGKSKSAFFKTQDERFIAKQLLTIWSVDEKEAFLEFAPAYIRYMMNAVANDCPTLLVKIAGVYSIKIKDLKTGETRLKMNVMVLENLWAGDEGKSIRFDLKGIKDRRVKSQPGAPSSSNISATTPIPQAATNPVWWDAEWIERFKPKAFVPETQKEHFYQALLNDTHFLTASNVMDYSLLLGVMEETRAFRCRIVDFLGAFTLAKQLESSSKKALKTGTEAKGNVTILPPLEYASRFLAAMDVYFTATPGYTMSTKRAGLQAVL